ncbi:MAG: O-antigen ligase family protein, partial [Armatimonadetes bacterium]|nr:O-antigen ligase family protein [Armatimonadota bacterium]
MALNRSSSVKQRPRPSPADERHEESRVPLSLLFLSAYFFLLPLLGGFLEDLRPAALRILLLASAGMRLYEGRRPGGVPWRPDPGWPVLLFFVWAILASLFGASWTHAYATLHFLGAGVLTYLLAADALRREDGRAWLFGGVLAGAALTGLWAVIEYRRTVVFLGDPTWRVFATFMNPNLLANYLLTALFLGLSGVLVSRRPWLLAVGAGTLLCAVALDLTGSRGAVVYSLPLAFLLWATLSHFARATDPALLRAQRLRMALILLVGFTLGAYFLKPTAVRVVNASTNAASGEANSTQFRLLTWKGTLRMIQDRPVFGWGPGTWEVTYPRYAEAGYAKAAHNSYLQIAAEMGIPGLILWLGVLAYGLGGRRKDIAEAGRASALVATMLHNVVDFGWLLYAPAMLTWGILGARPDPEPSPQGSEGDTPAPPGWKTLPARYGGGVAALAALLTILGLPPAYAELKAMEAESARAAKNFLEAKDAYVTAAALDPASSEWPRWTGRVLLYNMGDPHAALPHFQEAVRRDPMKATLHHALAIAHASAGQVQEASRSFEEALRLDPNATRVLMDYANL